MGEQLLVITERIGESLHNRMAENFLTAAARSGRCFARLETYFSQDSEVDLPALDDAYIGPEGRIAPLGEGAGVIILAEPWYWFNLSRAQKAALNHFYAHLLSRRGAAPAVSECALLICAKDKEAGAHRDSIALFQSYCEEAKMRNRGVLRTATVESLSGF